MNFQQAIASGFKKYGNFSGRATRSEYWYWMLFQALGGIAFQLLDSILFQHGASPFGTLFSLAVLVPTIAVEVRRLHDVDRSGWWIFVSLTIVGIIYPLLVWKCRTGTKGPNRFGDDAFEMDRIVAQFE
jgi:uncharacterized membrane protein YhaH (DUF805 family)